MTSKLKCPFCKQELRQDYTGVMYCCNEDCEQSADWYGSQILWRALIRAKQDLNIARKALKDARILANTHCVATAVKTIDKALKQIEHKDNK